MLGPYRTGKPLPPKQTLADWLKERAAGFIFRYWKWALAGVLVYAAIRLFWWATGPAGCGCHV